MLKYFCDCCGAEIKRRGKEFSWLCHLTDVVQNKIPEYIDNNNNAISERLDAAELCPKCYNQILILSVKKYFELKK